MKLLSLLIFQLLIYSVKAQITNTTDTLYYSNGNIKSVIIKNENGIFKKEFLGNGSLHKETISTNDSSYIRLFYIKDSCLKEYYYGVLNNDSSFTGKVERYSIDGLLEGKGEISNGMLKKEHLFYPSGKIKEMKNYKKYYLQGIDVYYFENGNVKEKGKMMYNCREGEWKEYFENGKIKSIGKYIVDVNTANYYKQIDKELKAANAKAFMPLEIKKNKNGIWKYYDEEGIQIKLEKYKDGLLL